MPTRRLPDRPDPDHLRHQAKTLLRQVRAGDPAAVALAAEFGPGGGSAPLGSLAEAQLVVARSYGFPSWRRLRDHLDVIARYTRFPHHQTVGGPVDSPGRRADEFLRLATLHYGQDDPARRTAAHALLTAHPDVARSNIFTMVAAGEVAAVRAALEREPGLARREGGPYRWEPLLYLAYSRVRVAPTAALDIARLLLAHGADPDAGYLWQGLPSPFTALTGAFGRGEGDQPPHQNRLDLARLLLEAGADPNDSQAMYNCGPGCPPPWDDAHLRLLLEFGLGQGDGGPWHRRLTVAHPTPRQLLEDELVFAASVGLDDRVRLVLAAGADPDGRGTEHPIYSGHRAYELTVIAGRTDIADLLRTAGAAPLDEVHELYAAVMRGETPSVSPEVVTRAIQRDPALPLRAAQLGRTEALRPLQRLGWDLNLVTTAAPLHRAALHGHRATVEELVALGADPAVRDPQYGGTPLDWARHGNQRAVIDFLAGLPGAATEEP